MIITMIVDQFGDENNGTTMTAKRFANILMEHGHTVRVVTASKINDPNVYVTKERNVPILKQVGHSQGMIFAKPDKKILTEAIKGSDVVHFLMPFKIQKKGKKICDKLNVPSTAAFHVQPENITYTIHLGKVKWVNRFIYRLFRDTFFHKFNHIHCPSEMIKNQLIENGYKGNLHVISNGVLPDFVHKDVPKPKELEGKYCILMVGRYSREKRQDLLINAIKNSQYEKNTQLILCGKGPWRKTLEKLGRHLTNKPIMKFCSKDELIDTINYCDLYVHASDAEIEAISCMEAFTCGLVPIISDSKISATNQFALSDRNLFECGNYLDLAHKIDYYIEHEEIKKADSLAYIEYAKRYAIDNCVRQLEDVFQMAIDENKASKQYN